jgi:23S rRNA pseudouridine2457 synthase
VGFSYYFIYKPFQVLSQFSPVEGKHTLADFFKVEKNVYPVGRLDYDSEGLLILTNDPRLNHRLLDPSFKHEREYWVQVEGNVTQDAINTLQSGVKISVDGKEHKTLPCSATIFTAPPIVPVRNPPIRFRKNVPDSWVSLRLKEGKNRQVRKMTAAVGFPTLRLIRYRIEKITVDNMQPGDMQQLSQAEMYAALEISI